MTPLEQIKKDFTYVSDGSKDKWNFGPLKGPFEGDCEEFALTLLLRIAGSKDAAFDMIRNGQARIEHVISDRGNGHAVLWLKDGGYVDSIHQFWRDRRMFDREFNYSVRDIERKLDGKTVRDPKSKNLLILAAIAGAVTLFMTFGGLSR